MKNIPLEDRLIFALDMASQQEAKDWVKRLKGQVKFYKVGLQLFLAGGFAMVEWIIERDLKVFLDLKFFDVPETVKNAVQQLHDRGVSFTTVHGNDRMLRAAAEHKGSVKILAVTALTSLDQGDLEDLGFRCSVEELVLSRARRALQHGCDGVISSGLEAPRLRTELGDRFLIVSPGIRPVHNMDDQKRTVDARQAFRNGADYIVVGRPIQRAGHPEKMVEELFEHIQEGLA
ncbi:orotidine-5'-phosphate decarboxylase [Desulfoferrobacter suflitae]|uniref:orotidine-5'-phosphate decarboxylase n=1 Tax=Desulfoferrobacter suflitae TaxID=2865782 RepID=UPI0021646A77|nr:orotidine-5'-phosphate decarboxylase [Desulfoferrobacter suflitae]MCK8602452.1 orotidine-5'-phosphate decarboxylase [Desulfoferrobacter suflitae]